MTDEQHEEYREKLVSFLKTKVDDIVECSRSLQVEFCTYFKQHLSSNVFVLFCMFSKISIHSGKNLANEHTLGQKCMAVNKFGGNSLKSSKISSHDQKVAIINFPTHFQGCMMLIEISQFEVTCFNSLCCALFLYVEITKAYVLFC